MLAPLAEELHKHLNNVDVIAISLDASREKSFVCLNNVSICFSDGKKLT